MTDLPGMLRILETQYELQYSESCVDNLFGNCFPSKDLLIVLFELHEVNFSKCTPNGPSTLAGASLVYFTIF